MTFDFKVVSNLLKARGIKNKELADYLGVSVNRITDWRAERLKSYNKYLPQIAEFFGLTVEELLSGSLPSSGGVKIPVLGNVAAGIPIDAITDIEDYEEITEALAAGGEYVALKIHGDSMEPRMVDGDVVIVRIQNTIESGETAVVIVNGGEATCKRIKKTQDGIMLISNNPEYEPVFYSNKEIEQLPVTIFGKVVELRAKFK